MSTPTPETDAVLIVHRIAGSQTEKDVVDADFARALERQRDELLKIAKRLVFAADAKLLSVKHRVVGEARAAITNAKKGAE